MGPFSCSSLLPLLSSPSSVPIMHQASSCLSVRLGSSLGTSQILLWESVRQGHFGSIPIPTPHRSCFSPSCPQAAKSNTVALKGSSRFLQFLKVNQLLNLEDRPQKKTEQNRQLQDPQRGCFKHTHTVTTQTYTRLSGSRSPHFPLLPLPPLPT